VRGEEGREEGKEEGPRVDHVGGSVLLFPLLNFPCTLPVTHWMFLAPAEDESVGTYTVHVTPKGDQVSARGGRALGGAHGKMGRGWNQLFVAGKFQSWKDRSCPPPKRIRGSGEFSGAVGGTADSPDAQAGRGESCAPRRGRGEGRPCA